MKIYFLSLILILSFNSVFAQVDVSALNKPIELINKASINYEKERRSL